NEQQTWSRHSEEAERAVGRGRDAVDDGCEVLAVGVIDQGLGKHKSPHRFAGPLLGQTSLHHDALLQLDVHRERLRPGAACDIVLVLAEVATGTASRVDLIESVRAEASEPILPLGVGARAGRNPKSLTIE